MAYCDASDVGSDRSNDAATRVREDPTEINLVSRLGLSEGLAGTLRIQRRLGDMNEPQLCPKCGSVIDPELGVCSECRFTPSFLSTGRQVSRPGWRSVARRWNRLLRRVVSNTLLLALFLTLGFVFGGLPAALLAGRWGLLLQAGCICGTLRAKLLVVGATLLVAAFFLTRAKDQDFLA